MRLYLRILFLVIVFLTVYSSMIFFKPHIKRNIPAPVSQPTNKVADPPKPQQSNKVADPPKPQPVNKVADPPKPQQSNKVADPPKPQQSKTKNKTKNKIKNPNSTRTSKPNKKSTPKPVPKTTPSTPILFWQCAIQCQTNLCNLSLTVDQASINNCNTCVNACGKQFNMNLLYLEQYDFCDCG